MATPTSYLQTLSSAEASAFVTSLQKVQAHLRQELAWINQQVQEKTVQLQGIETLLAEASTLGLLETNAGMISTPVTSDAQTTKESATAPAVAGAVAPTEAEPSGANDAEAIADASEQVSTQESAAPPAPVAAPPEATQGEKTASKPSAKAKSQKSSSTKKQHSTKTQSRPKASKIQAQPKSRALLRPEFADETLTDAVTQVLTQSSGPLHMDQLVSELYEDVSGEDLKRIKGALANVLSKGKRSGKWRNVGNGVYQIKA